MWPDRDVFHTGTCSGGGVLQQDASLDLEVGPGGQTYRMCVYKY